MEDKAHRHQAVICADEQCKCVFCVSCGQKLEKEPETSLWPIFLCSIVLVMGGWLVWINWEAVYPAVLGFVQSFSLSRP